MEEGKSLGVPAGTVAKHSEMEENMDNGVAVSMSGEWTDEKHSSYLKSMEASFVRQLHNHEYCSMDMLSWHSEDNLMKPNSLLRSNANLRSRSSEFKVLQSGCWKKINFDRAQPTLDILDESHVLLENQWIRHFRCARKIQEATVPDLLENDAFSIEPKHSESHKKECRGIVKSQTKECGAPTSSMKLHGCYSRMCHQESVGSTTEVSDQNFVDEGHEETQISDHPCRIKKMKTEISSENGSE